MTTQTIIVIFNPKIGQIYKPSTNKNKNMKTMEKIIQTSK